MKFGQLIEYKQKKNFSFQNHAQNEAGKLVASLFLYLNKALDEVKANRLQLTFNIFK